MIPVNIEFKFGSTLIGHDHPVFAIAELSGNHNGSKALALEMVEAAAEAGASAVKVQTYTADTITLDSDRPEFISEGLWEGRTLYDLYQEGSMPWEWQVEIFEKCRQVGVEFFSSPFDPTAVDFLHELGVDAFKIASFELVDVGLIEYTASKGKPMIISTGMGTLSEIEEAVNVARRGGCQDLILLVCTSSYPAPPEAARLAKIPHLAETFGVLTGLSDHTTGIEVPVAAVALGATVIEKHFILDRSGGGIDSDFSLEPDEFAAMVKAAQATRAAVGSAIYGPSEADASSTSYRRSLFVTRDIAAGEAFAPGDIRSVRPGNGLHPRHLTDFDGHVAAVAIEANTPLSWEMLGPKN